MLRATRVRMGVTPLNMTRTQARRQELEQKRLREAETYVPPVEPSPAMAVALYRRLLKVANATLVATDKDYFRRKVRYEFEITARKTSSRVRGLMYEKGQWMLANQLGGLV